MLTSDEQDAPEVGDPLRDLVPISALNHFTYCPRRCALIHVERLFVENLHTQRGRREHERVDDLRTGALPGGVRRATGLSIWSDRLGLIGRYDVVEFAADGALYPIEHKHGPRRARVNDDLQLCAQALCLEEMFNRVVARGAIFHQPAQRRREVIFTPELRAQTEATVAQVRELLASTVLPPPVYDRRCAECSMHPVCLPEIGCVVEQSKNIDLFEPMPEPNA
jgi:CRISPR-associated exonuclease Cas4